MEEVDGIMLEVEISKQTSGKLLRANELAEEILRDLCLPFTIRQPVAEPKSDGARLLRVLIGLGAHQEHAELEREVRRDFGGLLGCKKRKF